ncbi:TPA: fumarylacetoacetate hydrolase family protein [Clostridioides difficile]
MKFVTFCSSNEEKIGVFNSETNSIYEINSLGLSKLYTDMNDFIENVSTGDLEKIKNNSFENAKCYKLEEVKLCSPIVRPKKDIICLGLNYKDHVNEIPDGVIKNVVMPDYPIYFSKRADKIIGVDDKISLHGDLVEKLDYESELAVIIGKEGINISKEDAYEYIFGYTIVNDISERALQDKHVQWFRGKSLDTHTSMEPCIVHKEEFEHPLKLDISSVVNGEVRQDSNTEYFIFDIPTIINDLSRGMTLKPGDIISTGTPAGVAMGMNPQVYLKHGDIVECKVEGIGVLKNIVD